MYVLNLLILQNSLNILGFSNYNQILFQTPATPFMEGIIDLHHHIMFFLIIISIFII
jgi:hypothetical protein